MKGSLGEAGERRAVAAGTGTAIDRPFPSVLGHALSGEVVRLPDDVAGRPVVLLVAYRRAAQLDIDRWLKALRRAAPQVEAYEVPTIPSPVYRPLAGWIDAGMRSGVPREQWRSVVTVYGDGAVVRGFLGEAPRPVAHVVLLDDAGVVRWLDARGFSEAGLQGLLEALRERLS